MFATPPCEGFLASQHCLQTPHGPESHFAMHLNAIQEALNGNMDTGFPILHEFVDAFIRDETVQRDAGLQHVPLFQGQVAMNAIGGIHAQQQQARATLEYSRRRAMNRFGHRTTHKIEDALSKYLEAMKDLKVASDQAAQKGQSTVSGIGHEYDRLMETNKMENTWNPYPELRGNQRRRWWTRPRGTLDLQTRVTLSSGCLCHTHGSNFLQLRARGQRKTMVEGEKAKNSLRCHGLGKVASQFATLLWSFGDRVSGKRCSQERWGLVAHEVPGYEEVHEGSQCTFERWMSFAICDTPGMGWEGRHIRAYLQQTIDSRPSLCQWFVPWSFGNCCWYSIWRKAMATGNSSFTSPTSTTSLCLDGSINTASRCDCARHVAAEGEDSHLLPDVQTSFHCQLVPKPSERWPEDWSVWCVVSYRHSAQGAASGLVLQPWRGRRERSCHVLHWFGLPEEAGHFHPCRCFSHAESKDVGGAKGESNAQILKLHIATGAHGFYRCEDFVWPRGWTLAWTWAYVGRGEGDDSCWPREESQNGFWGWTPRLHHSGLPIRDGKDPLWNPSVSWWCSLPGGLPKER